MSFPQAKGWWMDWRICRKDIRSTSRTTSGASAHFAPSTWAAPGSATKRSSSCSIAVLQTWNLSFFFFFSKLISSTFWSFVADDFRRPKRPLRRANSPPETLSRFPAAPRRHFPGHPGNGFEWHRILKSERCIIIIAAAQIIWKKKINLPKLIWLVGKRFDGRPAWKVTSFVTLGNYIYTVTLYTHVNCWTRSCGSCLIEWAGTLAGMTGRRKKAISCDVSMRNEMASFFF